MLKSFSFWRTFSPKPPNGALPWTLLGDFQQFINSNTGHVNLNTPILLVMVVNGLETVALLRRILASYPSSECVSCCQQGHAGSKIAPMKFSTVKWLCRLTQPLTCIMAVEW